MCTISVVPTADGFRVVSNRDERYERPVGLAPSEHTLRSRTATFPVDPAAGGTWIGVNDRRLVAALLNRYPLDPVAGARAQSRGAIIPCALACSSIAEAADAVRSLDAGHFAPFRLLLLQDREASVVSSSGDRITCATGSLVSPLMLTGSGLGDFIVELPRRRLFDHLMAVSASWFEAQHIFHRHQWADHREISVLMQRRDAATVSRTSISIGAEGVSIDYERLW